MAVLGTLLRNRHAGEAHMAWNLPNLSCDTVFELTSPDFTHESPLPPVHAADRVGGADLSPALTWAQPPGRTAQLLLVVEDPDAPTPRPFVHCVALLEPGPTALPQDALRAGTAVPGVRVLRSGMGRGYLGPAPIKGHGPHRYAFQMFALADPITSVGGRMPEAAKPRALLAAATNPLGRGRIDGFYERP
ncbi:YbhB/YbcL family Raf kinase inhibitor-like protein [Nocardia sp. alder85J]|uniref:YbhB/YbcL family Raf kinase inhibitor-like protein n=1 Tax=Nocardia sp. alder85J TaxID=2862949 RepID=UPI001CD77075|nr:YbhB/YbcL family Raf kinase inhibitor-like protein [Nocardia sp. alder85J]MCX4092048.1 YbhB/YbcL family Raf kinase inhibitor-like protein [Nocardia sp. alder85J]